MLEFETIERFDMKKLALFGLLLAVCACSGSDDRPYDVYDFQNGGDNAPYYNERSAQFMQHDNQYAGVDSFRPIMEEEKAEKDAKWNTTRKDTSWQEYRGTMVRVEILLGDSELREMRLRMLQNSNGMDVNGDSRSVLNAVAEYEMKKVCGRNSRSFMIIYDKPSFDVGRPTPYFDFMITDDGVTMREYGFRCIYN
ncbi:MAG: hypothetical protein FWE50_03925 [Alphaproteobacteria bacterium]|nr:hypothetical protein [Alphaproteobacteria bacterium]